MIDRDRFPFNDGYASWIAEGRIRRVCYLWLSAWSVRASVFDYSAPRP